MDIENISFAYDARRTILHSVNAQLKAGKITTIIGPNGSGKSTLLGVMSNHIRPQSGQIRLEGKTLWDFKPKELAKRLAVVHQHNSAPADLTVEKLVSYGRIPHKSTFAAATEEDEQKIEWALEATRLLQKRHVRMDALSGGERQRVWIALALAQHTPILFLDEPTTYLDMYYQYDTLELIRSLNEEHGISIAMVLHDINQAIRYSHHIIAMKNGHIVGEGTPEEVITAASVKDIYGVDVIVRTDQDVGLYMVPIGIQA